MKLEVLLSEMNLDIKELEKKNIKTNCIIINQCSENAFQEINNFKIYSYNEIGVSNSRNRAIKKSTGDILLFCDDDVTYYDDYEKTVIKEFENNPKADLIFFNLDSPNRISKLNKSSRKIHFYNCLKYSTSRIAIRRNSLIDNKIQFNNLFGGNSKYSCGEDTLFIVDCLKNKMKLYSSKEKIGYISHSKSTWFNGYNEKYFFDKGALFCAISKKMSYLLCFQYLLRHRYVLEEIKFNSALQLMINGSKSYLKGEKNYDINNSTNI